MGVTHDVDEPVLGILDRVARAKEALRRAEERTGARTLRIVATGSDRAARTDRQDQQGRQDQQDQASLARSVRPAPQQDLVRPAPGTPQDPGATGRLAAERLTGTERLSSDERPPLPVPLPLREILPEGLRRGSITVVSGSTSLLLSLIAESSQAGSWAALVGAPSINLLAAAQAGVDLSRLVLVPGPGIESATTVAALLDGMDIVVVGPEVVLVDSDRRRLAARARERASVVLTMRPWQGASMTLTAERSRWSGLEAGHGRLRSRVLTVTRSGRSGAGVPFSRELWLPWETSVAATTQAPAVASSTASALSVSSGSSLPPLSAPSTSAHIPASATSTSPLSPGSPASSAPLAQVG